MARAPATLLGLGEWVWHAGATDKDDRGLIIGVTLWMGGSTTYEVSWNDRETVTHLAGELSTTFTPTYTDTP
jgi:hypothetical protein